MSNKTLADLINEALDTGREAEFIYNDTTYTFDPQGILDFISDWYDVQAAVSVLGLNWVDVPTSDPGVAGAIWNDTGTLKISTGA